MSDEEVSKKTTETKGAESSQRWWLMFLLIMFLLLASLYATMANLPESRLTLSQAFLQTQSKSLDVRLAEEHTKQMKIQARQAGVLQPLVAQQSPSVRIVYKVGNEGQHFLAQGMDYVFDGDGSETVPSATIAFRQPPVRMTGIFKLYGCGKTAWNNSWSMEASPYPLDLLLEECVSSEGNVKMLEIFANGEAIWSFKRR